jgi:hypothetical protein
MASLQVEDDMHASRVHARLQELALLERKLVYVFGPAQFSPILTAMGKDYP